MSKITHNLPEQPYESFFGRSDSIKAIDERLLQGGTFIASIDGVGGIGKTALAYHFCQEKLVNNPKSRFDYLIWISSKTTRFNPFDNTISPIENNFKGIETLFDTILSVSGFKDLISAEDSKKRREECEYILKTVPVFLVLDNLENVDDEQFLSYINREFNHFAAKNRDLKVLTTSRKRAQILDNPIEIRGLETKDALGMLNFYAKKFNIADIKNKTEHENTLLVEKVDKIPLGIEFITGQMKRGKTRGDIYKELAGYPALDKSDKNEAGDRERDATLSKIIRFSFQDMYENLDEMHQEIFVTVAILQRNDITNISLEVLLMITSLVPDELERILDTLIENQLLSKGIGNTYQISQMAINFARQNYLIFAENEDEIVGKFRRLEDHGLRDIRQEQVEIYVKTTQSYLENNDYEAAKDNLRRGIEIYPTSYRLYHELGNIHKSKKEYDDARIHFDSAVKLASNNVTVWTDYITMMYKRRKHNLALSLADRALECTSQDVVILTLKLNILKFRVLNEDVDTSGLRQIRELVSNKLDIYRSEKRKSDVLELLYWQEDLEYGLVKSETFCEYISVVDKLIIEEKEDDPLIEVLEKAEEVLKVLYDNDCLQAAERFKREADRLKNIRRYSLSDRVKDMNRLYNNKKDYDAAKNQAQIVLSLANQDPKDPDKIVNALRVLLGCYNRENDYQEIITLFDRHEDFGSRDNNCKELYDKAKRTQIYEEKNKMIEEIKKYLEEGEREMRTMVMSSLKDDEQYLLKLLRERDKEDLYDKWQKKKKKEAKIKLGLISYSSFRELVKIFIWCEENIKNMAASNSEKIGNTHRQIISVLEIGDLIQERNETYHLRLLEREKEDLENIRTYTRTLTKEVSQLKELVS